MVGDGAHVVGDDAHAVGAPVAWDEPATRRAYATYRLGALRWFAGGIAGVAIGIGLSTYAVLVLQRPGLGVFIVTAGLLGVIALGTGAGGLVRARRFRIALQRAPWQPVRLRVAGAHLRLVFIAPADADAAADADASNDSALGEDDGRRTVDARLMATSRWRVREVVGFRDADVRVCPLDRAGFVLAAQGLNNLYGLHPLARRRGRDRP